MSSRNLSSRQTAAMSSRSSNRDESSQFSRPITGRTSNTRSRPRTAASTFGGSDQEVICAISESRGISPTVGLAFVNISTTEAVLCQIVDNQFFEKSLTKILAFQPTEILFASTAAQPKSTLYSTVELNVPETQLTTMDRKYWAESDGAEYIQNLAFVAEVEAIKVAIGGNFFAVCCFAATLKYIELALSLNFPYHSMRIKYETSEGSMMIDASTVRSLELIQNLQNAKSKDCLFGVLNQTLTPMGARLLRSSILQPLTSAEAIELRYDALEELTTKEPMFFAVRQALKAFLDVDRILTAIIAIPTKPTFQYFEQSINNVLMLKYFVRAIGPIYEALLAAETEVVVNIRSACAPQMIADIERLIDETINEDITFCNKPVDLRNQRTYAVKAGVNGLLDVARLAYKETTEDVNRMLQELKDSHRLSLSLKYDSARQYYIQIPTRDLEDRNLPDIFINQFRRKNNVECQTLDLVKWNQKISDSHAEVLQLSDETVQTLIDIISEDVAPLFRISEAIALLDMLASFAQIVTTNNNYTRPEIQPTLAVKEGRHPIRERIHNDKFVPNDFYAAKHTSRFQIITGCNMSGKSTYIRSIALLTVMAQIGSFVPATYASFPIRHQLFARVSMDDSIEANVSTFAAEMRETAFILRNIDKQSLAIIDELGRGTSTRDGLAIAVAIAEALVESRALVWFATHFRDLAKIMAERNGVVNLHLAVEISSFAEDNGDDGLEGGRRIKERMMMLYKISDGYVEEQHYGLALAKVVDLPPSILRVAEEVSATLTRNSEMKKKRKSSIVIIQARKRKLLLGLKEQLTQASQGKMAGEVLRSWLQKLQEEFTMRMSALAEEAKEAEHGIEIEIEDDRTVTSTQRGESDGVAITSSIIHGGYEMTGALEDET